MTTVTSHQGKLGKSIRSAPDGESGGFLGLSVSAWLRIGILAALFGFLFWPNLARLWSKTNPFTGEDNWKHAPFVPLVGLYYLYVNREALLTARYRTSWIGLVILVGGISLFGASIYPLQNDLLQGFGMIVALFGLVAMMCGWEVMKIAWFPIVFLVCALPWPGLLYSALASPLQEFAAHQAVRLMNMIGVQSGQSGTKIFVEGKDHFVHTLNVAEACSGLKSLMTFIFIAGAVAFLSFRPLWQKLIMVFSAIPIAIMCNTLRVTMQGVLARYASMQWAEGAAHGFVGLVMMIPAFFLILLVGWILQNIFIDEISDKKALRASAGRPGGAQSERKSPGSAARAEAPVTTVTATPVQRMAAISAPARTAPARPAAAAVRPANTATASTAATGAAPVRRPPPAGPATPTATPPMTGAAAGAARPAPAPPAAKPTALPGAAPAGASPAGTAPSRTAPATPSARPAQAAVPAAQPAAAPRPTPVRTPAAPAAPGSVRPPGAPVPRPTASPAPRPGALPTPRPPAAPSQENL